MAQKQVTLRQKIDGTERTITVHERAVPLHEAAGWKKAPKSQQPSAPDEASST